jgi:dienelactone hydrolase
MEQIATLIRLGPIQIAADVLVPDRAEGLVLFAHGSGSGRNSPRNRRVAEALNQGALATVLIDLLTAQEEAVDVQTAELRFNIPLLAQRLVEITDWIAAQPGLKELGLGYFGASTGAAAALVAAADRPEPVRALVSRVGRPDLAGKSLNGVRCPTLMIVGSCDQVVLDLNRYAATQLPRETEQKIEIVEGATHLFEEPGALDRVAFLARKWFRERLPGRLVRNDA